MVDPELRDALRAYFLAGWEGEKPFSDDAAFIQFVDKMIDENRGGWQEMFLKMRDKLGRYPTFAEMRGPLNMG